MKRAWLLALAACAPAEAPREVMAVEELAIHTLHLGREEPRGVAPGFDLDGITSDTSDGRSCYQRDFKDAEGREGIDDQLALLMPLIDLAGEGALEGLVQGAINEGRALMILRMEHRADGLADLTMLRGDDTPLLGTDGFLLPGQTLALSDDPVLGRFEGASMQGNLLRAGPMSLRLPVVVFSVLYQLDLSGALIELELLEDGGVARGRLGGAVKVSQVLEVAGSAAMRTHGLEMLLDGGVRDLADLERDADGSCQALSMGVIFGAVPAFVF